jgi:inhibitor of cysteine peptidase
MIAKEKEKMKKSTILGLAVTLLLPVLVIGCKSVQSSEQVAPAKAETQKIEITTDDFAAQNNISKDIELKVNDKLTVSLGSNPTTGFSWGEAEISDTAVVGQESRNFIEPQSGAIGAPGKDVWTFAAKSVGTATIKMGYSRPWEGGEKDTWTLTINVTVK